MVHKTKTNTNIIEISAEYIYFVMVGDKKNLTTLIKNMENHNKNTNKEYNKKFIVTRLDIPILYKYDEIEKKSKKKLRLDYSIESAQSYAFAQEQFIFQHEQKKFTENDASINYMIMVIDDDILRFPKIDLIDEDPERMIMEWVKKYNGYLPVQIKKTIKPLSLVGYDKDILVYMAKI
jgi:hypothetical protein